MVLYTGLLAWSCISQVNRLSFTELTISIIEHSIFSLSAKVMFVQRLLFMYSVMVCRRVSNTLLLDPSILSELIVTVQLSSCACTLSATKHNNIIPNLLKIFIIH